jgi:adenine-specific DNA-methyltransferase
LASARPIVRAWIATIPEVGRRDLAAIFSQRAFHRFAGVVTPGATFSEPFAKPFGRLDSISGNLADAIGEHAAALPLAEGLHHISGLYPALLSPRERSAFGAFYTPPALVERLFELAENGGLDWRTARILDPASGGGAFLLPAAAKMRSAIGGAEAAMILAQIETRLCGFEVDPHAAWLSQAALELLLSDLALQARRPVPQLVRVCDALEAAPSASFDLVIGNPPYGRLVLTPERRARFARSLYGHANLYGLFTDIALGWAGPAGMIAFLTPTSVLGGQYFSALRKLLASEAPPQAVDFVCSRKGVFEDALQETMLALYRKGGSLRPVQVHYLRVLSERDVRVQKNGTVALPDDTAAPWLAPRLPAQSKIAAAASKMPTRLSDWGYSVSTGPLVWNRFKGQLRSKPGRGTFPLIWAECVTADGRFVYRAERRNHAPHFHAESWDEWLVVREPSVLVQRTTAKEQSRRLIAAELPASFLAAHGAVVVENHLNMVRADGLPKVSAATLAAVLNSAIVDQVFRCISGSVAVSAFELQALPLPSVEAMASIEAQVSRGAARAAVNAALMKLYGIDDS